MEFAALPNPNFWFIRPRKITTSSPALTVRSEESPKALHRDEAGDNTLKRSSSKQRLKIETRAYQQTVIEVDTSPEVVPDPWPDPPRLLVEWSSPWEEFKTAFRPALTRSPKALAGEAPVGIFPYRGLLLAWFAEFILILILIILPDQLAMLNPGPLPPRPTWDVIYYSGAELPQTADQGGAQAGRSGSAGGQEAHHPTQTIRVVRGDRIAETVADAPKIDLPRSDAAVANLLAFKSDPGPPPMEGVGSKLVAPLLPAVSPVPPSPDLQEGSRKQNTLSAAIVPPAPEVSHANARNTPTLNPAMIAPAPEVSRDKMRSANPLATTVVAPAPQETPHDLASSRAPISQAVNVVAPPVSAPQRDVSSVAKLSMPAPAVVAPPPSQVSHDLNSWGSTRSGDIRTQAVPPPPSYSAGGSLSRSGSGALGSQVVPPPVSIDGHGMAGNGAGAKGSGGRNTQLGAAAVVPPPPGVGGGQALSGSGRGAKGAGAGSPLDMGSSVAPPKSAGGNSAGNGVVMSGRPGQQVGVPNSNNGGAIAMSPTGTSVAGRGGSGGGSSIGRGAGGPGSGLAGSGSGAGKEGLGHGSDTIASNGISPYPGPGGAGNGANGNPAVPGVSVEGGTTTVTLPSFGDPGGGEPASGPGHSSANKHTGSGITIEATPRSGGVFAYYGVLKGDRNYSIYIDTSIGTAVMQYADPGSAAHTTKQALSAPEPMRKDLPAGLHPEHIVIACILDREGELKNLRVLEGSATAEARAKILVALQSWKFRPAFRGDEPVEVDAILGFGVDTR